MIYLILLSFAIFIAYLCYALRSCDIPASLSETYYTLNNKGKKGWLFCIALEAMGFTLFPAFAQLSDEAGFWYTFLSFFTCAGILFVGVSPKFRSSGEGTVHVVSASIAAAAGMLWSALTVWPVPLAIAMLLGLPTITMWKKARTFWLEMIAFFSVYTSILIAYATL